LERDKPLPVFKVGDEAKAVPFNLLLRKIARRNSPRCSGQLASDFGKNIWMLLKPTLTLMLFASVVSATLLVLIPWYSLLAEVTPLKAAFISVVSVVMPVPIALDVMFPAQLLHQGVSARLCHDAHHDLGHL
jgi:hypothetical protein